MRVVFHLQRKVVILNKTFQRKMNKRGGGIWKLASTPLGSSDLGGGKGAGFLNKLTDNTPPNSSWGVGDRDKKKFFSSFGLESKGLG